MGFVHLPEGPPPPAEISHSLPQLGDREISETLRLGEAYAAVRSALALFASVTKRVAKTPAADLYVRRVRVPDGIKIVLALRAVLVTAVEPR